MKNKQTNRQTKKRTNTRIFITAFLIAGILALAACGTNTPPAETSTTEGAQTTAAAQVAAETTQAAVETTQAAAVTTQAAAETTTQAASEGTTAANPPVESSGNFNETGFPIVNEKIELNVFIGIDSRDDINLDTLEMAALMEEKTNIHINYESCSSIDAPTRLNLMMSSGAYSDLVMGGRSWNINPDEYGVAQGIYIPLNDLIEKWTPTYRALLSDNDIKIITRSDGNMYAIATNNDDGVAVENKFYINSAWLQEANLPVPTTVADLTNAFRAFKANHPDGYPYSGQATEGTESVFSVFTAVTNFWGVPGHAGWYLKDDNTIEYVAFKPGYRDAFEWLHMLFTEELIDPEFMTQDENVYFAKCAENNVGFMHSYSKYVITEEAFWENMESMLPVSADGYNALIRRREESPVHHTAVTIANKHVPETMRWIDQWYEEDTMLQNNYGIFDKQLLPYENGPLLYTLPGSVTTDYTFGYRNSLYLLLPEMTNRRLTTSPASLEPLRVSNLYKEAGVIEPVCVNNVVELYVARTAEETDRYNLLKNDIDTLIRQSTSAFAINGITEQSWQDFMNSLSAAGIDEFTELAQSIYSRF